MNDDVAGYLQEQTAKAIKAGIEGHLEPFLSELKRTNGRVEVTVNLDEATLDGHLKFIDVPSDLQERITKAVNPIRIEVK